MQESLSLTWGSYHFHLLNEPLSEQGQAQRALSRNSFSSIKQ